jgi:light-regulated signal transduction histidine kinase (bacteriophytochrome)
VAKRAAALAAQAAQLQATNDELDAFSYSVSHDLRSPLRAVDGFAKILATNYGGVLDDAGKRYLDKVRSGAQHMGLLIDGLLSFSRLQRQPLTPRTVDLALLSREIWDELEAERVDRDIELTIDDLPPAFHTAPETTRRRRRRPHGSGLMSRRFAATKARTGPSGGAPRCAQSATS